MAEKKAKPCKNCGYFFKEDECPNCGSINQFSEKAKGMAVIFNVKESKIAENINAKVNGIYSLKY